MIKKNKLRFLKLYKKFLNEIKTFLKTNKLNLLMIIGLGVPYGLFLSWIFPKVSFDEFMFFVLLLYIPLSLKLKLDSRYPIGIALILLVVCAIVLAQGFEDYVNRVAIYAYYGLIIGVGLMFINYLKNPQE